MMDWRNRDTYQRGDRRQDGIIVTLLALEIAVQDFGIDLAYFLEGDLVRLWWILGASVWRSREPYIELDENIDGERSVW
jgi:hypothetical protein